MMGGFLYQSPKLQLILIMYSFIVGISIGIVYSVFDTISIMFNLHIVNESAGEEIKLRNAKNKIIISKIFQFSIDFLFSVVYTVIVVVFIFCANQGRFRFFLIIFSVFGFLVYKRTLGRLVSFCMQRVVSFLYRTIKLYIACPLYRFYTAVKIRFVSAYIKRRAVNAVIGDKDF